MTGATQIIPRRIHSGGFVFAFFRFSQTVHAGMMQRLVHLLTASDVIHVAVVPVWHCEWSHPDATISKEHGGEIIHKLLVAPTAFTAFMGTGFEEQPTETVLTPQYDLMFLPVLYMDDMRAGVAFLQSLRGASYNYLALPLTILPRTWKRHTPMWPDWLTRERSLLDGGASSSATAAPITGSYFDPGQHDHHNDERHFKFMAEDGGGGGGDHDLPYSYSSSSSSKQVFCSQMGLMLCYVCRALPHYVVDPAGCSPGELAQILHEEGGAVPCDKARVHIQAYTVTDPP